MVQFNTEDVEADLPRGRVRVYQEDVDGAALLIGEDTIDHTPKGEDVRLYVGDAFDIVGERIQTDFLRPSETSLEEGFRITLRNHKDEAVEVRIVEHLFRWSEWRILNASHDYTKLNSSTIRVPRPDPRQRREDADLSWCATTGRRRIEDLPQTATYSGLGATRQGNFKDARALSSIPRAAGESRATGLPRCVAGGKCGPPYWMLGAGGYIWWS